MFLKKYNQKFNLLLFIIFINTTKNSNFQIKKFLSQNYPSIIKAGLLIVGLHIGKKELKRYQDLNFVFEQNKIHNTFSTKLKFLYLKPLMEKIIRGEGFITKRIRKYVFSFILNTFDTIYSKDNFYQKLNNSKISIKNKF